MADQVELVERVARAMWEDAELRAISSPWVMPTRFEDNAERYRSLASAALAAVANAPHPNNTGEV